MIVREILEDPFKVVSIFDWFNDYRDTRLFLRAMVERKHPTAAFVLKFLEAGHDLHYAKK